MKSFTNRRHQQYPAEMLSLEVEDALQAVTPDRATGYDCIPAGLYRHHPMLLARIYYQVFLKTFLWSTEPLFWKGGILTTVPKRLAWSEARTVGSPLVKEVSSSNLLPHLKLAKVWVPIIFQGSKAKRVREKSSRLHFRQRTFHSVPKSFNLLVGAKFGRFTSKTTVKGSIIGARSTNRLTSQETKVAVSPGDKMILLHTKVDN